MIRHRHLCCALIVGVSATAAFGQVTSIVSGSGNTFSSPGGITLDPFDQDVYFLESNYSSGKVLKVPATGGPLTTISSSSYSDSPRDIAISLNRAYLYYTDTYNNNLYRLPTGGGSREVVTGGFDEPAGLELSPFGNWAYVADSSHDKVYRVDLQTGAKTALSITGVALTSPVDVAASPDGTRLFVLDSSLKSVYSIPAGGGAATKLNLSNLTYPTGITVSRDGGTLFVADQGDTYSSTADGKIFKLSAVTPQVPTPTISDPAMRNPVDLKVSHDQTRLFFTDNESSSGYGDVFTAPSGLSKYVPQAFQNTSFENGLTGFAAEGNAQAVRGLGSIVPRNGDWMAMMTTGRGAVDDQWSSISVALPLVEDANLLEFDFALLTDETNLDPKFFDSLTVSLISTGGGLVDQSVIVGTKDLVLVDSPADVVADFRRWTGWKRARFSLDPLDILNLQGESLLLSIRLSDSADREVISGLLVDNIQVHAPVPETGLLMFACLGWFARRSGRPA